MPPLRPTTARVILETVKDFPGISLEDLARNCPQLTWNEVFAAVDVMSRRGMILLSRKGFQYFVRAGVPHAAVDSVAVP
jgi:hypothetical protein